MCGLSSKSAHPLLLPEAIGTEEIKLGAEDATIYIPNAKSLGPVLLPYTHEDFFYECVACVMFIYIRIYIFFCVSDFDEKLIQTIYYNCIMTEMFYISSHYELLLAKVERVLL